MNDSLARPADFELIFDRHFAAVRAYLARRAGLERADDLAATTFTVAFARRHTFVSSAGDARPWLLGIATNVLRNSRRAERRDLVALDRLASQADRDTAAPWPVDDEAMTGLLAVLDADQRDVLLLYAWEGMSYAQIALALDAPIGTVRSRLARARRRLRHELQSSADARSPMPQEGTE